MIKIRPGIPLLTRGAQGRVLWTSAALLFQLTVNAYPHSSLQNLANVESPPTRLVPGQSMEKELKGGEADTYEIEVGAGQFFHAVVDQKGIDVALALYGPDGKLIATMDSPNGTSGPEQISIVAEVGGEFRLKVTSEDKNAAPGKYRVSAERLRSPGDADRARISAERVFAEAGFFDEKMTVEARLDFIGKYEKALELWRASGDVYEQALVATSLGGAYDAIGQPLKSRENYEVALPLYVELADLKSEADTLSNIGATDDNVGENSKALELYERSLTIYRSLGVKVGEASVLTNMAIHYNKSGDTKKALDLFQQALSLETTLGMVAWQARTLNGIGHVYGHRGETEKALDFYQQALPRWRAANDRVGECTTLGNIAEIYRSIGEAQKALDFYGQVLTINQTLGNAFLQETTLGNIALIYSSLGEGEKAVKYLEQSLQLEKANGDRFGEATTLSNIGALYDSFGERQKALEYYNEALPLFRDLQNPRGEAVTLSNIGLVYGVLGEHEKALEYFEKALAIERSLGERPGEAAILANLGSLYDAMNEKQKALDLYNQALPLHQAVGNRAGEANVRSNLGKVYAALGNKEAALESYSQALRLASEIENPDTQATVLGNLMAYWRANGNPSAAIFFGKQGVNRIQEMRRNISGLQEQTQQSFLKSKEKLYRDLADLLIEQGRLPEAEQVLDLLKDEEYFEFIRRDSKDGSALAGPVSLTKEEEAIDREYEANAERVTTIGIEYAALRAKPVRSSEEEQYLKDLELRLAAADETWEKFLDTYFEELGKTDMANESIATVREHASAMQRVLRQLPRGTVALYTLVTDERYRVVLITPNVMVPRDFAIKADDLRKKVAEFRQALMDPNSDAKPKAQELYNILIAPVAKELEGAKGTTLMWSLDGVLRYVPIAALYDGHQYFVEKYRNTVFTPSSIPGLTEHPNVAAWHGLGMGVSKSYGGFEALPAVPTELHRVIREETRWNAPGFAENQPASSMRPKDASEPGVVPGQVMLDESFTTENMEKALEKRYPLVHIASHFDFAPGNETGSFLLLGGKDKEGERLTLAELRGNPAFSFSDTELLTLSACNTAISGTRGDGREVDGIGFLAQQKGARAVVASLWSVYDSSTGLLMENFYKLWTTHRNMPKAEALREAQLTLLNGPSHPKAALSGTVPTERSADFSHPFYWAPFILIGNWR